MPSRLSTIRCSFALVMFILVAIPSRAAKKEERYVEASNNNIRMILGASHEPHAMRPLNNGAEYINDDLKNIERDFQPCVFIAERSENTQAPAYEVDVECFQLVGQIERKSRLYTTDAAGKLLNSSPALLGVFPFGDAAFDAPAWNWINSRVAKSLAGKVAAERRSAHHETIVVMPQEEQQALLKNGEITPPKLTSYSDPHFTDMARAEHIQGQVLVKGTVDTDGIFKEVHILTPLGYGLDDEALKSVEMYRFLPARLKGVPVPVSIRIEVNFHIYP